MWFCSISEIVLTSLLREFVLNPHVFIATSFGFKTQESHSISVHVNPGIEDGEIIVIKNEGHKLSSNKIGDVEVEINYKQHPYFEKDKNNLIYKKQLTLKEALCGFNFTMKHLNGREISLNNKENPVVIQNGCKKEIPKMLLLKKLF